MWCGVREHARSYAAPRWQQRGGYWQEKIRTPPQRRARPGERSRSDALWPALADDFLPPEHTGLSGDTAGVVAANSAPETLGARAGLSWPGDSTVLENVPSLRTRHDGSRP